MSRDATCFLVGTSEGLGPTPRRITEALGDLAIDETSRLFLTRADGPNQPHIWNWAVIASPTGVDLPSRMKTFERALGRQQRPGGRLPREVDIDLLFTLADRSERCWTVAQAMTRGWSHHFYCRLPVFDLCDSVTMPDFRVISRNHQLVLPQELIGVFPFEFGTLNSWTIEAHARLCQDLLRFLETHYGREYSLPIAALAAMDGEPVARQITRGGTVTHAEVLALREAIVKLGHDCTRHLWVYSTLQPCAACLAAMCEAGVAGCVWMCDRSQELESLYTVDYDPLVLSRWAAKPPALVHGILRDQAMGLWHSLTRDGQAAQTVVGPQAHAVMIGVTEFYDTTYYEYSDPVWHPTSYFSRRIHEQLLAGLRESVDGVVLDIGCGVQQPMAGIVGVELSIEALRLRRCLFPGSLNVLANADLLPVRKASVGGAFAGLVLDHLPDPTNLFRQLGRVCQRDATLIVTLFDWGRVPRPTYSRGHMTYTTAAGKFYKVPSHQLVGSDLCEMATREGWAPIGKAVEHILPDSAFRLLELQFRNENT